MKRYLARFVLTVGALLALAVASFAGGWAIITLNDFPDYAFAEKPLNLRFTVRQHGRTLLVGLKPSVRATTADGRVEKAAVTAGPGRGEYTSALILPEPGEWIITVRSGFNESATTLPALKVISAENVAPIPFSPATKGARLFASKGCTGCHRHVEANPERKAELKLDLTGKRFAPDYLKRFLKDPSIKPAEMPDLKLNEDEIEALVAFINNGLMKQDRPEAGTWQ